MSLSRNEVRISSVVKVWYREPWPWILMSGPAIVVVASLFTAWIAYKTSDGLVTEDYYRKGLSAHQTIESSEKAVSLGLRAGVRVESGIMSVRLWANDKGFQSPTVLKLTVSHPTRAGLDQVSMLIRNQTNETSAHPQGETYTTAVRLPTSGHWLVLLEDEQKSWRLMGNVILPATDEAIIGSSNELSQVPADIRNTSRHP